MNEETFERLCELREILLGLGQWSVLDALANGDDEAAEAALEEMMGEL